MPDIRVDPDDAHIRPGGSRVHMPSFAWLRARPRALASVGFVGALAVTIGTLA